MKKKLTSSNIVSFANILKILSASFILAILSFSSCESSSDDDDEDLGPIDRVTKPIANFSFSTPELNEPFKVSFANASSDAKTYRWDFGDDNTSTEENPVHTYAAAGIYDVTLTATDSLDQSNAKTISVTLMELMLIADFTYSISEDNLLEVNFNNISENAVSYAWDFGDDNTSTEMNPTHAYAESGVYTVELTVTSATGETEVKTEEIEVSDGVVAEIMLPGFESSSNDELYAAWHQSENLGGKIQSSTSPVYAGSKCGKLPGDASRMAYQKVEVKPNKEYVVSFYYTLKADAGTSLIVKILNDHIEDLSLVDAATIASQTFTDQSDPETYVRESITFTTTDNNYIAIYLTNTVGGDVRFDDFTIEEVK